MMARVLGVMAIVLFFLLYWWWWLAVDVGLLG